MVWPFIPVIGGVVFVAMIGNYVANNPGILEDVADTILVRCEISDLLYEAMISVGLNQDHIFILDTMSRGEEVAAKDVRDIGSRVKDMGKSIAWDTICHIADR